MNLQRRRFKGLNERGDIAVTFAILLPSILAVMALLIDGGYMMIQFRRAQIAVDSAAFAAAQRLDRGQFFRDQIVVLEPQEAVSTGTVYGSMNSRGNVRVTSVEIYGNRVIARGYATVDTIFARMFGLSQFTIPVASNAAPLYGIDRQGQ